MRLRRRLGIAVLWLALAIGAVAAPGASAAKSEVQPAEEEVDVTLFRPVHGSEFEGTHFLSLKLFPLRGVAVARTVSNDFDIENNNGVNYVARVPEGRFDGYLDVHFKGLGSFVGEFVPEESGREGHVPKGCVGRRQFHASGSLRGKVSFRGAGGYAHWSSSSAEMSLQRSSRLRCRKGAVEHVRKPKTLLGYVAIGPGHLSNWRYTFEARRRTHRRVLYVNVVANSPREADFDAGVYESLPGGIDVSRVVNRAVRHRSRLEVSQGGYHPEHATLRPPPPFSGVGHYSRRTHRLTGPLAVRFPGLTMRIGSRHTVANLRDEHALREKSPSENLADLHPARVSAAEPERPTEAITFQLTPKKGVFVDVEIHPLLGVAVVKTYLGLSANGAPRRRSGLIDYAARIPKGPAEGKLDVRIPGIGSIVGELVPKGPHGAYGGGKSCEGTYEAVEFLGTLEISGNGEYPAFDLDQAEGGVYHTPLLVCEPGAPESSKPNQDLFEYFEYGAAFSNENRQILTSELSTPGRASFLVARQNLYDQRAVVQARTIEWLPGHVAAARKIEVLNVPGGDFTTSSKAAHAKSAKLKPPAPFSGSAVYTREGSLSRPRGKLTGSLSVDLYGVTVRLAGANAKAFLFNFHPGD